MTWYHEWNYFRPLLCIGIKKMYDVLKFLMSGVFRRDEHYLYNSRRCSSLFMQDQTLYSTLFLTIEFSRYWSMMEHAPFFELKPNHMAVKKVQTTSFLDRILGSYGLCARETEVWQVQMQQLTSPSLAVIGWERLTAFECRHVLQTSSLWACGCAFSEWICAHSLLLFK